jgi:hypothetical protein
MPAEEEDEAKDMVVDRRRGDRNFLPASRECSSSSTRAVLS